MSRLLGVFGKRRFLDVVARVLTELGLIDRRNNPVPPMEAGPEGSKVHIRVIEFFPLTCEFRLVIGVSSLLRPLCDYLDVRQVVNL